VTEDGFIRIFYNEGNIMGSIQKLYSEIVHRQYGVERQISVAIADNGDVFMSSRARSGQRGSNFSSIRACVFNVSTSYGQKCFFTENTSFYDDQIQRLKDGEVIYYSTNIEPARLLQNGNILFKIRYNTHLTHQVIKDQFTRFIIVNQHGDIVKNEFTINTGEYDDEMVGEISDMIDTLTLNNGTTLNLAGDDGIHARITGTLKDECVTSPNSTNPDLGWNWALNDSCRFSEEPLGVTRSIKIADVNGDNSINAADAMLAMRYALGFDMRDTQWIGESVDGNMTSDVNCSGGIHVTDAMLILRYALGLDMITTSWCVVE
jgi:hypothetical protein